MAGRKILCVDDEPTVLSVTMTVLRDLFPKEDFIGVTVPEEAVAYLSNNEVAVLLTDLSMPNMDGAEVVKAAHQCNPDTVKIIVTGRASTEGLIRALNEGHLWKCLEKPWNPDQMHDLVKSALELYEERCAVTRMESGGAMPAGRVQAGHQVKKIVLKGGGVSRQKISKQQRYRIKPGSQGRKLRIMDKRYKDMELVKEGGSGAIYKAFDTLLDIPVAIKIISEKISANSAAMKELVAEARIAMGLSHKHIVRLHNIEQGNNFYYLVMEFIKGETLRDILERLDSALPPDMCLQINAVLEDALSYAHRRGIFHRDLKPDNLMVDDDGILKIIDFGLACLGETFRRGGHIAGTPYYMSPEEMACEVPDQRTDVFSLAVMMHEFVQGTLPPHGAETDLVDPMDYVPVATPFLPEPLQHVLNKGFARSRTERWETVSEFAQAFREAMASSYSET